MTHVTWGWLPRTGISSGTLRSVIEYGLPLPFLFNGGQQRCCLWLPVYCCNLLPVCPAYPSTVWRLIARPRLPGCCSVGALPTVIIAGRTFTRLWSSGIIVLFLLLTVTAAAGSRTVDNRRLLMRVTQTTYFAWLMFHVLVNKKTGHFREELPSQSAKFLSARIRMHIIVHSCCTQNYSLTI